MECKEKTQDAGMQYGENEIENILPENFLTLFSYLHFELSYSTKTFQKFKMRNKLQDFWASA